VRILFNKKIGYSPVKVQFVENPHNEAQNETGKFGQSIHSLCRIIQFITPALVNDIINLLPHNLQIGIFVKSNISQRLTAVISKLFFYNKGGGQSITLINTISLD